ncbi:MAG: 2,4-dihydroxyhept-2-ene-1,7-dioic acid aldolase [delta proteobacterium ML8_D]|jgi:2-dehydro-3-deoxyglucarate aldolase|nr:MAG: 2,4-dihydroxyhept-2-ene-1,7-dioic acid aldolase [delta proteobacterium ML8_D]
MKNNPLKRALRNHEQTYGTWLSIAHPLIPEILAAAGFDWMVVDMEHSSIGLSDLLPMVISIEACGSIPLVRVGENNANLIKRVMDVGAYGVILPNVKSREEALSGVNAVKYPPEGSRGIGLYRAHKFGREFEEYKRWLRDESVVIVQIEHINAVNNIDDILTTPGIDAFMIGPYDLSGSLGKPGMFDDPEVDASLQRVMLASKRHRIPAGFHSVSSDPMEAVMRREQGYKFLAFSLDSIFLGDAACSALTELKKRE